MSDLAGKKLEFWNSRAQYGEQAGTNDLPLKQVEMATILPYIKDGQKVLDVGCGNGISLFSLLDQRRIDATGLDFAEKMIEDAKQRLRLRSAADQAAARFAVGDVQKLGAHPLIAGRQFDVIITERVLINLASWEEQRAALQGLVAQLSPGGMYLMLENLEEGLQNINRLRSALGLAAIEKPWHNRYLREQEVESIDFAELAEYRDISSTYYLLSRIVNAWVAKKNNSEPRYDSDINQLALPLVGFRNLELMGLGQTRLWVWKRKR